MLWQRICIHFDLEINHNVFLNQCSAEPDLNMGKIHVIVIVKSRALDNIGQM